MKSKSNMQPGKAKRDGKSKKKPSGKKITRYNYGKMIEKELSDLRANKIKFDDGKIKYTKGGNGKKMALSSIISKKRRKKESGVRVDGGMKAVEVTSTFEVEMSGKGKRGKSPRKGSLDRKRKKGEVRGKSRFKKDVKGKKEKSPIEIKGSARGGKRVARKKSPKIYKNRGKSKKPGKTPSKKKPKSNMKGGGLKAKKAGKGKKDDKKGLKGKKRKENAKPEVTAGKGKNSKQNVSKTVSKTTKSGVAGVKKEKKKDNKKWLANELKKVVDEEVSGSNTQTLPEFEEATEELVMTGNEVQSEDRMEKILRNKLRSFETKKIAIQIANAEEFPSRSGKLQSRIEEAVIKAGRGNVVQIEKLMGGMMGFFQNLTGKP